MQFRKGKTMSEFKPENTELTELGLTHELIMTGERIELDPETKIKRKEKYVRMDFITKIIDAYADDLLAAYKHIESLTEQYEDVQTQLENVTDEATKSTTQLKQILASDAQFTKAEQLLATLEKRIETFVKTKKVDDATIQQLNEQVSQLKTQVTEFKQSQDTVEQLKADVELVLENFQRSMEEAGINLDYEDDLE